MSGVTAPLLSLDATKDATIMKMIFLKFVSGSQAGQICAPSLETRAWAQGCPVLACAQ